MMKKMLVAACFMMVALAFCGCADETPALRVMTPQGSPALGALYLHEEEGYAMDIVHGPDPLVSAFGSGSHDVILAPTNLGAKMYQAGHDYQLLGAITFGNYYLITEATEGFTFSSLDGKEIVMFGRMQTGDAIMQYLCGELGIEPTFTYVDSVQSATALWLEDPATIILTAEPSLSVLSADHDLSVIDVQETYADLTGRGSYPQAGVFVRATLDDDRKDAIARDVASSVERVLDEPSVAAADAAGHDYPFTESVMAGAIPRCHLGFVRAGDVRDDLEAYFTRLCDLNPALIGEELPDDGFYAADDA